MTRFAVLLGSQLPLAFRRLSAVLTTAFAVSVATLGAPSLLRAQMTGPETEPPLAVVRELFDAMRAGDSARVRAVFHPRMGGLVTAETGPDGQSRVSTTTIDGFAKAIGTPHPAPYDERIFNPRVLMDGPLASVWVDYSFYVGTQFSHCGVDVFQLAKDGPVWKIVALADTRRKTGCQR